MNRRDLLKILPLAACTPALPLGAVPGTLKAKPRFRTAICAYSYRDALQKKKMTYEDLVRLAVELDVDGLDMTVYWFPNTSDNFLLPLRRAAYRMGVEIYSICIRTDMCRPAGAEREKEITEAKRWVDVALKLGAGHIRVFGGDVPKGATEDQAAAWCAETLKTTAEYAGARGIILGIENHGGITERAERIIQILKQVNSPWAGVNLDMGNFTSEPYPQIEMCAPYAVNVQMKTEVHVGPKKDEPADWDRMVGMLAKAGYKGYVALEYEGKKPAETEVPLLMKELRRVCVKYAA